MPDVSWLLRKTDDLRRIRTSDRTLVDDATWRADIERVEIGEGLHVFLSDVEARRDVRVEPSTERTDQWVNAQVTLAGRADLDFIDGTQSHATPDHALLFRLAERRAAYCLGSGTKFHSVGYTMGLPRFARLFEDGVPEPLAGLLGPDPAKSCVVGMPAGRAMRNVAAGMFARGLNGPLRAMMLEGAVIQLLALQAGAVAHRPARTRRTLTSTERDAVHEARRRLLADMRQPPSLGALAAGVGLTEKRLNTGFRMMFGTTVFATLRNERLEHARIALQSGRLSIEDAAFLVGYNHVTNFINAFTGRYGAPPRQYAEQKARLSLETPAS